MHELSLVAELVDRCVELSERTGTPVRRVRMRYASTVPLDGLRQAFVALTAGTPVAGAELDAHPFDLVLDCPGCGFHGALGHDDLVGPMAVCPRCDEPTERPRTAELELVALE